MIGGAIAVIVSLINRANRNQQSQNILREKEQAIEYRTITTSLDRLSDNIERLIEQKEQQNAQRNETDKKNS
uniref:Uncharacterized protein n=1 Tax=viral metagenome TaxID=1070528 RepID=A0A6M3L8T1_9ZZZZ